jgi:hypothetical protein
MVVTKERNQAAAQRAILQSNQRNAPCRHRALVRAVRTAQVLPAGQADAHRLHTAQSVSLCDIAPRVRISGTTSEQSRARRVSLRRSLKAKLAIALNISHLLKSASKPNLCCGHAPNNGAGYWHRRPRPYLQAPSDRETSRAPAWKRDCVTCRSRTSRPPIRHRPATRPGKK